MTAAADDKRPSISARRRDWNRAKMSFFSWLRGSLNKMQSQKQASRLVEYIDSIDGFDDQDDPAFFAAVQTGVDLLGLNADDFGRDFDVSESIVDHWYAGNSAPHPAVRADIVDFMRQRAIKEIGEEQPADHAVAA